MRIYPVYLGKTIENDGVFAFIPFLYIDGFKGGGEKKAQNKNNNNKKIKLLR